AASAPVLPLTVDACHETQVAAMVDAVLRRFGRIDAIVTTVGGAEKGLVADMSLAEWNDLLALNLTSQFLPARAVLPAMRRQRGGSIVAITSNLAWGGAGRAHYAAAKAGIIGFVRSLALEVAPDGIRVNALAPGLTRTERVLHDTTLEAIEAQGRAIPLGRLGQPEDQAEAIAFLAGPASRYMTWHGLQVN